MVPKKVILLALLAVSLFPAVFALNLNVQTNSTNLVMIQGVNEPMTFNAQITNNGPADAFYFYNLVGFMMSPSSPVQINSGQTVNVPVTIIPVGSLPYTGPYVFNYYIRNQAGDKVPESFTFSIMNLKDALSVGASEINPGSSSVTIYIRNNVNYSFSNMTVDFSSPFFTLDKQVSLSPNQQDNFQISLNKADFKSLLAGFYTLSANVNYNGTTATVENNIQFSEQSLVNVSQKSSGFFIHTETVHKTNNGNVVANSQTIITKNIISRIFTTFSPQPDTVSRQGLTVYYTWENTLQPGSSLIITATTDWLIPLIIVLLIAAIVLFVAIYSRNSLDLEKEVAFVRTKGGEFAMKVTLKVHARKFSERVTVTDRLPHVVKLYDKFLGDRPTRIDENIKRIEWYFDKLQPGETRIVSYVIYSKVGVLGRFALPRARAIYERDGKVYETESNQAFLVTEQSVPRD